MRACRERKGAGRKEGRRGRSANYSNDDSNRDCLDPASSVIISRCQCQQRTPRPALRCVALRFLHACHVLKLSWIWQSKTSWWFGMGLIPLEVCTCSCCLMVPTCLSTYLFFTFFSFFLFLGKSRRGESNMIWRSDSHLFPLLGPFPYRYVERRLL